MATTTLYRGTSARAEHGTDPHLPVYGKFAALLTVNEIRTHRIQITPETGYDEGTYCWSNTYGSTGAGYNTEQEAMRAGIAFAEATGFTRNRDAAERKAIAVAWHRHQQKISSSNGYAKRYG